MASTPTLSLAQGGSIPILGLGTWDLRGERAYDAVRTALDLGYRHVDTATMYENEAVLGRAVADSGIAREELFLTTKLLPARLGRERETLEDSLRDLQVEFVDLWLIHSPPAAADSPAMWRRLLELRDEGKARAVGVSNYSPDQVDALIEATDVAPAVNQIRWSPLLYDADRLAHSGKRGVVLEGYSPFRAGTLEHPVLLELAAAHGVTPSQVVLRWHVEHGVVVIPKSARPERLAANLDVFGFSLDPDEVARVDGLAR